EAEIVELRGLGIHERSFHCRFPSGASWWARPSILPYPSVGVEPSQSGGTSPAATARRPAVDTLPRAVPGVGHRSTTLGGGGSRVHVLRVERRMSRPRGTRRRLRRAVTHGQTELSAQLGVGGELAVVEPLVAGAVAGELGVMGGVRQQR